jgi:branched-chain amino acid aminotransferase
MPYTDIRIDPASKLLNFAQVVFEGLKAYRGEHEHTRLFRPKMNWQRINSSCERMMMPTIPEELFFEGLCALTAHIEPFIPTVSGQSLYLRPLIFGTQPDLGLGTSDQFTFIVIASPSEAIATGPLRIVIERDGTRAASGGTGAVKFSGNYGASLYSSVAAQNAGFDQPLWLDASEHRYIEELSVMNFFAVIDGAICTPELGGTILPGITRDSLITIAKNKGIKVNERKLDVDEVLKLVQSGRCSEAFACGTATIIAPISHIGEKDGTLYELPEPTGRISQSLRKELLDVQEGRKPDVSAWLYAIPRHYYPQNT